MTTLPRIRLLAVLSAITLSLPALAAGQDTLARAKDYYASASYDEALQVLDQLKGKSPATTMTEIAAYQMFCLVALGRNQEATNAIEAIVHLDPLYHPSEVDASPRVRTFFENIRRPLLPAVVKQLYVKAKETLDKKDYLAATAGFDRVIALIDEMGAAGDQGVADLRTLASGFRDLSKAATPPPAPVKPVVPAQDDEDDVPAVASRPPAPAPAPPKIYGPGDTTVIAPVALRRAMPGWQPVTAVDKIRNFRGSVELLIDERGKVQTVVIAASVHPDYDAALARAARDWTFQPATRDGVPVRYRLTMDITLAATAAR